MSLVAPLINAIFSFARFVVPSKVIKYVAISKSSSSSTSFLYSVWSFFRWCFFSVPIIVRSVHACTFQFWLDACARFSLRQSFVASAFHLFVSAVKCASVGLSPYCLARLYSAVPSCVIRFWSVPRYAHRCSMIVFWKFFRSSCVNPRSWFCVHKFRISSIVIGGVVGLGSRFTPVVPVSGAPAVPVSGAPAVPVTGGVIVSPMVPGGVCWEGVGVGDRFVPGVPPDS